MLAHASERGSDQITVTMHASIGSTGQIVVAMLIQAAEPLRTEFQDLLRVICCFKIFIATATIWPGYRLDLGFNEVRDLGFGSPEP